MVVRAVNWLGLAPWHHHLPLGVMELIFIQERFISFPSWWWLLVLKLPKAIRPGVDLACRHPGGSSAPCRSLLMYMSVTVAMIAAIPIRMTIGGNIQGPSGTPHLCISMHMCVLFTYWHTTISCMDGPTFRSRVLHEVDMSNLLNHFIDVCGHLYKIRCAADCACSRLEGGGRFKMCK